MVKPEFVTDPKNKNVVYARKDWRGEPEVLGKFVKTVGSMLSIIKKYKFEKTPNDENALTLKDLGQVVAETPEETKEREEKRAKNHADNERIVAESDASWAAKEKEAREAAEAKRRAAAMQENLGHFAAVEAARGARRRRRTRRMKFKKSHTRRRRYRK